MDINEKKNDPILAAWWVNFLNYVCNSHLGDKAKQDLIASWWQLVDPRRLRPSASISFDGDWMLVWRAKKDGIYCHLEYEYVDSENPPWRDFYFRKSGDGHNVRLEMTWNPGEPLPAAIEEALCCFEVG